MRLARYTIILLATLAVIPCRAHAVAPAAWQAKATALADQVFKPSCGPLTLSYDDAAQSHATLPNMPSGATAAHIAQPTGWAREGVCVIHLDRSHHWLGYPEFCHVVLHETGNVVGYGDDWSDPKSIRYPMPLITRTEATINGHRIVRWSGVDHRCMPTSERTSTGAITGSSKG